MVPLAFRISLHKKEGDAEAPPPGLQYWLRVAGTKVRYQELCLRPISSTGGAKLAFFKASRAGSCRC